MKKHEITQTIDQAKAHYRQFHSRFDDYLDQFCGNYPQPYYAANAGRSMLFIPKTYTTIVRKVADFFEAFLGGEGAITIEPTESAKERAEILEKVVNHYERANPEYKVELMSIFYDFYIYGIGIARLFWREGVKVERIDPRDFCFDVNATSLSDCQYFVHTFNVSRETMDSYNVKAVSDSKNQTFARHKVDELYYREGGVWKVASVHGGQIFDERELKRLPFAFGYAIPKIKKRNENNVYGDSECRILRDLQAEINETRNQMRDATRKQINPIALAEKGSGLSAFDYYNALPGDLLEVNKLSGVQYAPIPSTIQANNELRSIDLEIQEATGVTTYNSGISRAGMLNQTATGMNILTSEGKMRIGSEAMVAHNTFFKTFCALYAQLVFDHAPLNVIRKAAGERVRSFPREDFDFIAKIEIEKPGERELKIQRLTSALSFSGGNEAASRAILQELLPNLLSPKAMKAINNTEGGLDLES